MKKQKNLSHYIPLHIPSHSDKKMHGFNKQLPAKLQSNQLPKKQDVQRDFLNYQCSQQAIFIALLLRHCKVVLAKPVKKCCVTHQFLRITTLIYPNNVELNVEKEVEQLCENKKQQDILDGVATKTADRRYKSNKRAESMNLLIKELKQFQYTFESRVTESKKNTSKLEIVYTISHKNQTFFDSEQIDSIGTDLNKYYTNILSSNKKSIVLNNDTYFFELLKSLISFLTSMMILSFDIYCFCTYIIQLHFFCYSLFLVILVVKCNSYFLFAILNLVVFQHQPSLKNTFHDEKIKKKMLQEIFRIEYHNNKNSTKNQRTRRNQHKKNAKEPNTRKPCFIINMNDKKSRTKNRIVYFQFFK